MPKYSYLWKTTDTGKKMWLPLRKGQAFAKRGMLKPAGKFKMGMSKGATVLKRVK